MVIGACLCWYEEPPEALERLVRSLCGVADLLVSADGPWELFAGPLRSPEDQQQAIERTAAEVGLAHHSLRSDARWPSQVEKRSALYGAAAALCDWLFVVDGDEHVSYIATSDSLRSALDGTERDVAMVRCHDINMIRPSRPMVRDMPHRRLFRAAAFAEVIEAHNGIVTHDGRWLAGPRRISREPALDLCELLTIEHRHWSRPAERNRKSRIYYEQRQKQRVEVH